MTMSGRSVFDAATAKPPASPTSVRVTLTTPRQPSPTILNGVGLGSGPPPGANARADATFEIVGIIPGTYGVTAASTGWWLRSVMLNGRDLLDEPIDITAGSGNMDGAIVTFTDKRSELSGTLTTASGQPASEFTVLVFPSDRALWRPGARRIKTARPATDGAFTFAEMPAGEYFLAALTDFGPDDLNTSSFLEQIMAAALRVTITEGAKVRQDLRIAR
jgi:hypothetical protein